jgi:hypothetical protein
MPQDQSTFNEQAYLAANPDVAASGMDAWSHYSTYGQNEGRQAQFDSAPQTADYFDEKAYLAANPDVAAAIGQSGIGSGYEHYINYGQNEGRQGNFNVGIKENAQQASANPDIQNLEISGATEARDLYNLKNTDPNQYYQQIANKLGDQIYVKYGANDNYDAEYNQLQAIKEKNPQAYYANQLKFLGQQAGWQIGQNTNDRNGPVYAQIQSLIPEAQKAGLSPEQINSIVGGSINQANYANQGRIKSEQSMGSPGAFTGAIPVLALAATAAATGGFGLGGEGLVGAELAGPTYGELGYTGLAEGAMGPTYAEMGYTGLNNAQAIAAADAAAAANGLSGADAIKYANRARQLGNLLNNLGGSSGNSVARMSGQNSGINPQQLASALGGGSTAFPSTFIGQIKANEHPFLFDVPGQTKATEGTYDVSGSNLAKALRKA